MKRMQLSGSLAKGTALKTLNDIDVACYISGANAPHEISTLLDYLAERLRKAFPNFTADQVKPQTYSVTVCVFRKIPDSYFTKSRTGISVNTGQ
nr:nucleotidyltransferase [Sphingobium sp. JAI105]